MRYWVLISGAVLCAWSPCLAQDADAVKESEPVVFMRGTLKIVPSAPGAAPQNTESKEKPAEKPRLPHSFFVDVKAAETLGSQDFYSKSEIRLNESRLFVLEEPQIYSLSRTPIYAPVDVLMITQNGVISKIAPNLNLSELVDPISNDTPIRAILQLRAGTVARYDIRPGDMIDHASFHKKPVILE